MGFGGSLMFDRCARAWRLGRQHGNRRCGFSGNNHRCNAYNYSPPQVDSIWNCSKSRNVPFSIYLGKLYTDAMLWSSGFEAVRPQSESSLFQLGATSNLNDVLSPKPSPLNLKPKSSSVHRKPQALSPNSSLL